MDEQGCPRCKTTKYRNPSLKLLVNVCGHALCENCVDLLFVRGSGACPECGTALRRSNFRVQLFEDSFVEKEVNIRKKILKDFNKKEEDFPSLREYNDYLEMIESIIFNLTNGIDAEETRKQIEKYKKENQELIKKNRSKLSRDEEFIETLIEQEREEHEIFRQQALQEDLKEKQDKKKNKEALIDELMFSDLPADYILATHKRELSSQQEEKSSVSRPRQTTFSSGIQVGKHDTFIPLPKKEEGELYTYAPLYFDNCGPPAPTVEDLEERGYLDHIREASEEDVAGGYLSHIGCQRAVQESFAGLFFTFESVQKALAMVVAPSDQLQSQMEVT